MQAEEMVDELKEMYHQQDCLAQEEDKAEKEWERMSCWIIDLLDQMVDVKGELWRLDQDLRNKREELEQLKVEASGLGSTGPVVTSSVSGFSKGAAAGTGAPKKKKGKQKPKRHLGLSSEEGQEYCKSYLAHLSYWHCLVLPTLVNKGNLVLALCACIYLTFNCGGKENFHCALWTL